MIQSTLTNGSAADDARDTLMANTATATAQQIEELQVSGIRLCCDCVTVRRPCCGRDCGRDCAVAVLYRDRGRGGDRDRGCGGDCDRGCSGDCDRGGALTVP